MRMRAALVGMLLVGFGTWGVLRAQKPFKEYPGVEYTDFPLPADYNKPAEWIRARLKYRNGPGARRFRGGGPGAWTTDYPRSDRHFLEGVRRLTRIDARSVEQPVEPDGSDDIYNWPFIYAVEVGQWTLNEAEAAQIRDFLDRGGFLMVDDFHGTREWQFFVDSMSRVFPDKSIVELQDSEAIFHNIYDLDHRVQVPGAQYLRSGRTYEQDGVEARWRGIYDDKGRVVVAICHNMDLGDAWEWSDDPRYPEAWASLAYRIGMNYIVYDLTH